MTALQRTLILACCLLTGLPLLAQQTAKQFTQVTDYLLYLPEGYANDTTQRWPLILFLHGAGERGDDIQKVAVHGPAKLVAAGKKLPFIIVSPQCKPNSWWEPESLYSLLKQLKKDLRVDPDRVYLTGLSMGGFGSFNLGAKHPEEFAAIAPICGGGDPADGWKLRHIPMWVFHGAKDRVVPLSASQQMVDAIKPLNPGIRFTVYPEADHDSWTETYNNDSLFQWFLTHRRFRFTAIQPDAASLQAVAGTYRSERGDTVMLVLENGALQVQHGTGQKMPLKAAAADIFFLKEDQPIELQVIRDAKKNVTGLVLRTDRQEQWKKVPNKK
ncbi:MAG: PHB depolymerase family esterase [Candidatus Pseudobacter hemicellulosilyticus]|uniref:PHB depolymerase family esterase n=1 Tax=Candidatus Pseudobacter hemicellulosilyticus TaxID=3121375 RepID=A0AAJ6BH72_9BACT|nr:MAG: PHB depolymerase family esterase [Pseudobacter sp.]